MGEVERDFHALPTEKCIRLEVTAPNTPHFNGVAGKALGLLTENTIAALEKAKEANDKMLWTEQMNYAWTDHCNTIADDGGMSAQQKWSGSRDCLKGLRSFGTRGYL